MRGAHDDRRQRVLLTAALLCVLSAFCWAVPGGGGQVGLFLLVATPTAFPLRRDLGARSFTRLCAFLCLYLTVLGVLGVLLGLFLFLPAALAMAAAAAAGPRRGPVTGGVLVGLGTLVATCMVASGAWCLWHIVVAPRLAEPHTFRAELTVSYGQGEFLGPATDGLERLGATSVAVHGDDAGERLEVRFPDDLPADRRARLRAAIVALPDVDDDVELCPVLECG